MLTGGFGPSQCVRLEVRRLEAERQQKVEGRRQAVDSEGSKKWVGRIQMAKKAGKTTSEIIQMMGEGAKTREIVKYL